MIERVKFRNDILTLHFRRAELSADERGFIVAALRWLNATEQGTFSARPPFQFCLRVERLVNRHAV